MIYEEDKFLSHSSGGWEVQDQGTGRFGVWWDLASDFQHGALMYSSAGTHYVITWQRGVEKGKLTFIWHEPIHKHRDLLD